MSNRYRLIKEYPGSPKLDTIINDSKTTLGISYYENCKAFIENYPEFWQEVVEKDYEILSFKLPGNNIVDLKYARNNLKFMLKNSSVYQIYSVKRLSDGEIFTIGDKTNFGLISKIVINNNSLSFYFEQKSCGYNLQTLIKWKPLFTTEQRSEIEEIIKNIIK